MGGDAPELTVHDRKELLEALLGALLAVDQAAALGIVAQAVKAGWSADDVRFGLITPALYEVGVRWQRGEIGVAEEHLATSVCEWLLFGLAGSAPRSPATGRRAVVGCSAGELHELGARIVGHVLVERGWRVLQLGASTPTDAWSQTVRARHPDAAVVCTSTQIQLQHVGDALEAIKAVRPQCRTVVGGEAYWGLREPAAVIPADHIVLEARSLASELETALD